MQNAFWVWSFLERDWKIERSYRMAIALRILGTLFQLMLFFYVSRLISRGAWEELGYPGRNLATTAAHPRLTSKF